VVFGRGATLVWYWLCERTTTMAKAVGIDLGTTNSVIAAVEGGISAIL
jgi:molecular chaperone DnaK (HSP70)